MTKAKKIMYMTRMILFIIHFFLLFDMIGTLWQIKPLIYLFFLLHFIYVIKVISEVLSQKEVYKTDFLYNIMQICMVFYFGIFFYRIRFTHVFYMRETVSFFNINFAISCFLFFFLLSYSFFELKNKK